ncbi:MAG TPA: hypothetical protein VGP72_05145 [Planctomycetota bacterium]
MIECVELTANRSVSKEWLWVDGGAHVCDCRQEEDRRKTKDAGFDQHLTKPADPDAIEKLLAQVTLRI